MRAVRHKSFFVVIISLLIFCLPTSRSAVGMQKDGHFMLLAAEACPTTCLFKSGALRRIPRWPVRVRGLLTTVGISAMTMSQTDVLADYPRHGTTALI
ncbi:hypothetical protein EVAR_13739_1 [Eumeta japonica]|uniref:Secreted protein n=1 Tax=Eumeta variegata TaxID=151549 RepID=A0A4C1UCV0_EUMVA|nr:hypothetical protein EVAR_13739_1 [Eumeta japonica]